MQSASVEVALRSALKRRAGYVLVVNCALGVLLFRANRLLDPANRQRHTLRLERIAAPQFRA